MPALVDDSEDVALTEDRVGLAAVRQFRTAVLGEVNGVALFDFDGLLRAVVQRFTRADGDDFAFSLALSGTNSPPAVFCSASSRTSMTMRSPRGFSAICASTAVF